MTGERANKCSKSSLISVNSNNSEWFWSQKVDFVFVFVKGVHNKLLNFFLGIAEAVFVPCIGERGGGTPNKKKGGGAGIDLSPKLGTEAAVFGNLGEEGSLKSRTREAFVFKKEAFACVSDILISDNWEIKRLGLFSGEGHSLKFKLAPSSSIICSQPSKFVIPTEVFSSKVTLPSTFLKGLFLRQGSEFEAGAVGLTGERDWEIVTVGIFEQFCLWIDSKKKSISAGFIKVIWRTPSEEWQE